SGGRTFFVDASDIVLARAASNYVEVVTPAHTYLARSTLAELERLLVAADGRHLRVHRSYIVNRDRIRTISPTGDGNVSIELDTGETVPGSRSYRDRLPGAGSEGASVTIS
ncbi:MAG: LytTR family DNA-binding domain-containing protein, partial [Henriciella sp.]